MAKTVFIKVRVTEAEKQAYQAAADSRCKPLSEMIRAHLDRAVKRDGKRSPDVRGGA